MKSFFAINAAEIAARYRAVRERTLKLVAPLSAEDMMVQTTFEASPAKWHLAHTAWFFESFVLHEALAGYQLFHKDFSWLFNSYYRSFANFPDKRLRSSFSRPALDEVMRYRKHVDEAMERLLANDPKPETLERIELGLHHEEQHQELILTDIQHAFFTHPLRPAYCAETAPALSATVLAPIEWIEYPGGMAEIGHGGEGFAFDNESPRHKAWLEPFALASRLVSNGEYAEFVADGGYQKASCWLSDGMNTVESERWQAPLYWRPEGGSWTIFTLRGELPLEAVKDAPVCCLSFYEADAYARWAGHRLPTEFEWERAAQSEPIEGNLLDSWRLMTSFPAAAPRKEGPAQLFGDVWEWTASAYLGYPGYRAAAGAIGEYNGKFMSGQMVLRGGSFATPADHIRASYRNFWAPATRYQFAGLRLAR